MRKGTVAALRGSIKKWEGIIRRGEQDMMDVNCPLCWEFDNCCTHNGERCPVYETTGVGGCDGSFYRVWKDHQVLQHGGADYDSFSIEEGCDECMSLAKAELKFLKSLLPKSKKKKAGGRARQ